jgi:hypothetical protein
VGVGADWWDDWRNNIDPSRDPLGALVFRGRPPDETPEQRRRREEDAHRAQEAVAAQRWDPGRRLQEFGQQFQESPALATLGLAGDLFQQTRVPLGMAQGLVQGAVEARAGRPITGAIDQGPFGKHELPPVQNPLDPAEARARFEAMTPAPLGIVEDMLMGGAVRLPGVIASGIKGGLSAAGRDLLPSGGELMPLAGTRAAGVAQQAAGMLGTRTAAGLVGAEAARETWSHTPDDQPLAARVGETALGGLAGFGLMHWAGGALRTQASRAVATPRPPPNVEEFEIQRQTGVTRVRMWESGSLPPTDMSPELRSFVEGQERGALQVRQGLLPGQRRAIGGDIQDTVDTIRQAFSDRLARPETIQNALEKMNGPLPEAAQFYPLMRVASGAKGAANQFIQDEITPVFQRMNLGAAQVPVFERQYLLRMAESEASRADPLAIIPEVVGKNGPDAAKAAALRAEHEAVIAKQFPQDPTLAQRMNSGIDELTAANNKLLSIMNQAGVINDQVYTESVGRHSVFGVLRNYADATDVLGSKSLPQEMTVTGQGIHFMREHTTEPPSLLLEDQMKRIPQLFTLAAKNRAMNAFDAAMEPMARAHPEWSELWRPNAPARRGAVLQPNTKVPPGMGRVAFFKDGEYQERLTDVNLAHALSGMGAQEMNTFTRIAARFTEPFRLGITALNFPFIYGHMNRTLQLAGENAPPATMGLVMKNVASATMDLIADGADQWLLKHQNSPHVQQLPARFAESAARALGGDPEVVRGFRRAGAGYSSIAEEVQTLGSAQQVLGIRGAPSGSVLGIPRARGFPVLGGLLGTTEDAAHALTFWADQAPRVAMWKVAPEAGITGVQRTLLSREVGIDFQKAGNITRTLNSFIPLLNAREQGWLNSMKGAWDDPERFAFRASAFVAMPAIAAYTHNRLNYPDLYDKIPVEERDRYFNIIIGRGTDAEGRETPIRFRIVKSPGVQLIASPIEHFLDANYHVRAGEQEIDPVHRTARSGEEMWLSRLAMALPWEPHPDQMDNPMNHAMAALTMMPLVGVPAEMYANKDYFSGRPIIPEDARILPPQYQTGPRTSAAAKALSRSNLPLVGGKPPADIDYLVGGWGGSYAMNWMYMGDHVLGALQRAGLVDANVFQPKSAADLGLGPDAPQAEVWKRLGAVPRPDTRPWWQVFIPRIFSQSGGADTIAARVEHLGTHEQEVWHQTRQMNEAYSLRRMELNENLQKLYQDGGKLSHAELRKREGDVFQAMHDSWETLHGQYPLALTESRSREEFLKQIPGFTSEAFQKSLPTLPPGVTAAQLEQRWTHPGGQDISQLNPYQRAQLQGQELMRMSQETKLPTSVLKWHIGAAVFDRELPGLPVPALDLERAYNEYRAPRGADGRPLDPLTTPTAVWAQAKRDTLTRMAQEMHQPEPQLAQWIANRHTVAAETNPTQQSRVRAEAMANDIHDPHRVPRFADRTGQPLGDPGEWDRMEAELDQGKGRMQQLKLSRDQWPMHLQMLDDAFHRGEVAKVNVLSQDPRAADYERWYGTGRDMTLDQWERYQSGQLAKYRSGTPQDWLKWDMALKMYRALPGSSPMRAAMKPAVEQIRQRATPGWRGLLKLDESEA